MEKTCDSKAVQGAVAEPGVAIELNVPFYPGAVPGLAAVVPEVVRADYVAALAREVRAAAGDAAGAKVAQVVFVGGTAANMGLAAWCRLMDDLRVSFPGAEVARLRFDVAPELVDAKTAQYAFRYRALFNLVLEGADGCASDAAWEARLETAARARDVLLAEKLDNFGFQLTARTLGEGALAAERLRGLVDLRPAYVRVVDAGAVEGAGAGAGEGTGTGAGAGGRTGAGAGAGVGAGAPTALVEPGDAAEAAADSGIGGFFAEAGFRELAAGLFCRLGRIPQWFRPTYAAGTFGFGLGSRTRLACTAFATTDDVALYVDQAGRSGAIYRAE